MQTRNFSYNLLRITSEMPCVRAWAFRVNEFSIIYHCSLVYIHCCLLNTMRLIQIQCYYLSYYPDPDSLRYLIQLMRCKRAFLCLSLLIVIYVSVSRDSNPLSHDPEALSWRNVDQTSAFGLYNENDKYNGHIPCVVVVCLFGFNVAFSHYFIHITTVSNLNTSCSMKYFNERGRHVCALRYLFRHLSQTMHH